ncbi:hypothetical protein BGW80DRAFT_773876 [Lactifluus volemus]|nr:hypothetical protein BGW80DRAFT_773876 [Lactifluus volemus]
MELENVMALLEAESGIPVREQSISYNGRELSNAKATMEQLGTIDNAVLLLRRKDRRTRRGDGAIADSGRSSYDEAGTTDQPRACERGPLKSSAVCRTLTRIKFPSNRLRKTEAARDRTSQCRSV